METKKKDLKIQYLRALAIIFVIMNHTSPSGLYPASAGWYQVLCRPILNLAVATFLFLSGYLTPLHIDNVRTFYKKRILRVLIPYVVWSLLYSSLPVIFSTKNVGSIFYNLLTAQSAGQMYYIFVYIQLVLVTPLLNKLVHSKFKFLGWLIAPVSTIIFVYVPMIFGIKLHPTISLIWVICFLGWFTFYYLGLLLGNRIISVKCKTRTLVFCYVVSILLQIGEGYIWWRYFNLSNCGSQYKLTSFLTCSLFLLMAYKFITSEKAINPDNLFFKAALLIGDCSFGMYLSHVMVINVMVDIFPAYRSIPFCANSLVIAATTLLCVILGQKICGKKLGKIIGVY